MWHPKLRRKERYPTKESIVKRLNELDRRGVLMSYYRIRGVDSCLIQTIDRKYPSLKEAVEDAGLEYRYAPDGYRLDGKPVLEKEISTPQRGGDYSYFLGVLLGDGWLTKSRRVGCEACDFEMLERFAKIGEDVFSIVPFWCKRRDDNPAHRERRVVQFGSKQMANYLLDEVSKGIPEWISCGGETIQIGFINGFFDAEGHVSKNLKEINIVQKDDNVLRIISKIFKLFGISHRIHFMKGAGVHKLAICRNRDKVKFYLTFGFSIERKHRRLAEGYERWNKNTPMLKWSRL